MRDQRGVIYVETLIAFLPVFLFFLGTLQIADLSAAHIIVRHAATVAARAAVVVMPDDGRYYNDEDNALIHAYDGARRADIEHAADIILGANPRLNRTASNVEVSFAGAAPVPTPGGQPQYSEQDVFQQAFSGDTARALLDTSTRGDGDQNMRQQLDARVSVSYRCLIAFFCPRNYTMVSSASLVYQGARYVYEAWPDSIRGDGPPRETAPAGPPPTRPGAPANPAPGSDPVASAPGPNRPAPGDPTRPAPADPTRPGGDVADNTRPPPTAAPPPGPSGPVASAPPGSPQTPGGSTSPGSSGPVASAPPGSQQTPGSVTNPGSSGPVASAPTGSPQAPGGSMNPGSSDPFASAPPGSPQTPSGSPAGSSGPVASAPLGSPQAPDSSANPRPTGPLASAAPSSNSASRASAPSSASNPPTRPTLVARDPSPAANSGNRSDASNHPSTADISASGPSDRASAAQTTTPHNLPALRGAMPTSLRNVPIVRDPSLQGATVRVQYTHDASGRVTSVAVHVGPDAQPRHIADHVNTVRAVQAYQGLSGRAHLLLDKLNAWIAGHPQARPGSLAWETRREVEKLQALVDSRARALGDTTITDTQRAELAREQQDYANQLAQHEAALTGITSEPGRGYVAAEDGSRQQPIDASGKAVPTKNGGYRRNTKRVENNEKIQGQPEPTRSPNDTEAEAAERLADANREVVAAELAAQRDDVVEVYVGAEADRLINGSAGKSSSVDVVAVTRDGNYLLYEAKGGNEIGKAVQQLEKSAARLGPNRVVRNTIVTKDRINAPGYSVSWNGQLQFQGKPVLVAGKPVHVIFTTDAATNNGEVSARATTQSLAASAANDNAAAPAPSAAEARPTSPQPSTADIVANGTQRATTPQNHAQLAAALPRDLRNVPIVRDPNLTGSTVRAVYTYDARGRITNIELHVGPDAQARHIADHVATVRVMQRYQGLAGKARLLLEQLNAWIKGHPNVRPGSLAWETRREIEKLQAIIQSRADALSGTNLSEAQRAELAREQAAYEVQLAQYQAALPSITNEAGRGYVAANGPVSRTETSRASAPQGNLLPTDRDPALWSPQARPGEVEIDRENHSGRVARANVAAANSTQPGNNSSNGVFIRGPNGTFARYLPLEYPPAGTLTATQQRQQARAQGVVALVDENFIDQIGEWNATGHVHGRTSDQDRGHLLGKAFGGANIRENLFALWSHRNRGQMSQVEKDLKNRLRNNQRAWIQVDAIYADDGTPLSVVIRIYDADGTSTNPPDPRGPVSVHWFPNYDVFGN